MKLASLALAALASSAVAAPAYGGCLTEQAATDLVNRYAAVVGARASDIGGPVETAQQIIARNFVEYSDSANQQIGLPFGVPTVQGKANFIEESQSNPPVSLDTKEITVACNTITFEWVDLSFGSGAYRVAGIHIFEVNANGRISEVRFEFNSFAGALDNGFTIFYPNGTQYGV